jgi:hypothetical protein
MKPKPIIFTIRHFGGTILHHLREDGDYRLVQGDQVELRKGGLTHIYPTYQILHDCVEIASFVSDDAKDKAQEVFDEIRSILVDTDADEYEDPQATYTWGFANRQDQESDVKSSSDYEAQEPLFNMREEIGRLTELVSELTCRNNAQDKVLKEMHDEELQLGMMLRQAMRLLDRAAKYQTLDEWEQYKKDATLFLDTNRQYS